MHPPTFGKLKCLLLFSAPILAILGHLFPLPSLTCHTRYPSLPLIKSHQFYSHSWRGLSVPNVWRGLSVPNVNFSRRLEVKGTNAVPQLKDCIHARWNHKDAFFLACFQFPVGQLEISCSEVSGGTLRPPHLLHHWYKQGVKVHYKKSLSLLKIKYVS